jgi:surface polysaccharide O-acyltransferase-like enzyme
MSIILVSILLAPLWVPLFLMPSGYEFQKRRAATTRPEGEDE